MTNLADRTEAFALRIVKPAAALADSPPGRTAQGQLPPSGTGAAADDRAARRARSHAEFAANLGIAGEEGDETLFWLGIIMESNLPPANSLRPLHAEGDELLRIIVASGRTAKRPQRAGSARTSLSTTSIPPS